jgi:hypothetical protein
MQYLNNFSPWCPSITLFLSFIYRSRRLQSGMISGIGLFTGALNNVIT